MSTLREDYRRMAKPAPVEGVADLYLIRPLGALLVAFLRHLPITPTGVSLLAVATGWAGAWFYYEAALAGRPTMAAVWGGLLFLLHSALDSADGQLARLTDRHTEVGRLIDGFCDTVVFFGIYFAIWYGYVGRGGSYPLAAFLFGTLSGLVFGTGAALVEYVRLLYQDWALGSVRVERTDPDLLSEGIEQRVGILAPFFDRWYGGYTDQQRLLLPVTARLEDRVTQLRAQSPEAFARFREIYAREQRPMVRRWWPMAPNAHKAIIAIGAFVPAFEGGVLAGLGSFWTFVGNVALVPVGIWLIVAQSRLDSRMLRRIEELDGQ